MRRLPSRRPFAAAALLTTFTALVHPAPAVGQEPEREMIPRDVAEALIGSEPFLGAGGEVRILVGRMPDHLVSVVPADSDADVVGTLIRGYVTAAVLDLPGTPDEVLTRWEDALLEMGWERHQPTPFSSSGGFAASPPGRSHQFCMGDSLSLSLDADRHDGDSRLRVLLPRARSTYNICRHQQERARRQRGHDSPLPVLTPPSGVRMRGVGSGGGGGEYHSRGRAETGMPVDELTEHYHQQLVGHGWEPLGQAVSDDVVVYRYRVPDEERDSPWLGLLSVARGHDADERHLTLEARRGDR